MPGRDRTGPMGQGPLTGRGAGYCGGRRADGFTLGGRGRAMGQGRGRGRGWRHQFWATGLPGWARLGLSSSTTSQSAPATEREFLIDKLQELQQEADFLNARLKELDTAQTETD